MMMDPIADPFLNLYNDGQIPSIPENLLFSTDDNLTGFDLDLPITSPNKFEQETISNMTENPEFETELKNFLANFPSPDSSSSSNHNSTIDLLDDFPFSPFQNESNSEKLEPTLPPPPPAPPSISTQKLPVIINTTKITNQHLPKVVQLTKGNVVYIQAPNNSNKSQTNFIQLTNCLPTILINTLQTPTTNEETTTTTTTTTSIDDFPIDDNEFLDNDIDHLPMTPSTSSESPDERTTTSPDITHENNYHKNRLHRHHPYNLNKSSSTMLTNLDKLPTSGPLLLTDEELKLIKQEGYQIPTKLPLNKTEEKILKKIRRKIKNKISAQESRRKKKEYVDTLERQIAKYIDENGALKERVSTMEKNQRSLMQELQSLRSMIGKGTPTTGKVLMVLCLFFAVLFGIWSPIINKQSVDDFMHSSNDGSSSQQKSMSSSSSSNNPDSSTHVRSTTTTKSLLEQQDLIKQEPTYSNYIPNNYKSRVLLSFDEHEQHYHGPYLPANQKYKSSSQQQTAAPGYTYSNSVEKYVNKKFKLRQEDEQEVKTNYSIQRSTTSGCLKRPLNVESTPSILLSNDSTYKTIRSNHTSNYRINEKVVVIENSNEKIDHDSTTYEGKPLKIIRVERTTPAIGNDTLKLSHRTVNE